MSRRYYLVLDLNDDEWEGCDVDLADWAACGMNKTWDADEGDVEIVAFAKLEDFLAANVLDALASSSPGSSEVPEAA